MLLRDVLNRNSNNFDLARLLAACMVIYGHANAFLPAENPKGGDFVAAILKFDYSGSLAVKIFFFLSGLVVTNSLLEKKSLLQFTLARIFRIWPALLAVLLFCTLIIGPLNTILPLEEYLTHPGTRRYITESALMNIQFHLPGVFSKWQTNVINGSLWTIPYEVKAYLLLAAIFSLGLHRVRVAAALVAALIIIDPLFSERILSQHASDAEIDLLAPSFATGALMALFKDKIEISPAPIVGFLVLFLYYRNTTYAPHLFYFALFFFIIYLFSRPAIIKLRPRADISYGIYLWSWPIQNLLSHNFQGLDVQSHRIVATVLACSAGWLSWHILEKRFISYGQLLNNHIKLHFPRI